MSQEPAVIEVPGEITFRRTVNIPPVRLELPIRVYPLRIRPLVCGLPFLLFGLTATFLGSAVLLPAPLTTSILLGCVLLMGAATALISLTCIRDALRRGPALILDKDGVSDRRAGAFIPWTAVKQARIIYDGGTAGYPSGVHLALREEAPIRQNPFRIGRIQIVWLLPPNEVYVPLRLLRLTAHTLGHAIIALAKQKDVRVHPDAPAAMPR